MKRVVACGAGRCGTRWFADLISSQPGCVGRHESFLGCVNRPGCAEAVAPLHESLFEGPWDLAAESSLIYLSLLPEILNYVRPFRIVVLTLDRAEQEDSWARWLRRYQFNPFSRPQGVGMGGKLCESNCMYPAFGPVGPEEGVARYLDWAQERIAAILTLPRTREFRLADAGDPLAVTDLLRWAGCRGDPDLSLVGVRVNAGG